MKRLGSLFLILSVIIILAACQMSSGGIGNEPAEEKIKIRIAWWGGDGRHAYTQELLERYTQTHPEVEFEALPSEWDDYFDKLTTQAASGKCRTLFRWIICIFIPLPIMVPWPI